MIKRKRKKKKKKKTKKTKAKRMKIEKRKKKEKKKSSSTDCKIPLLAEILEVPPLRAKCFPFCESFLDRSKMFGLLLCFGLFLLFFFFFFFLFFNFVLFFGFLFCFVFCFLGFFILSVFIFCCIFWGGCLSFVLFLFVCFFLGGVLARVKTRLFNIFFLPEAVHFKSNKIFWHILYINSKTYLRKGIYKFSPVVCGCRIRRLHLCRGVRQPSNRKRFSRIRHKTIWRWASSPGSLGNLEYTFIAISPWFTQTR